MVLLCPTCSELSPSIAKYFAHQWVHRHSPNVTFTCPFPTCGRIFSRYINFCSHKRSHRRPIQDTALSLSYDPLDNSFFKCTDSSCKFRTASSSLILNHLDSHIRKGQNVACLCGIRFQNRNSLRSHFNRSHKDPSNFIIRDEPFEMQLDPVHFDNDPVQFNNYLDFHLDPTMVDLSSNLQQQTLPSSSTKANLAANTDVFLKSFALMLLRLQSKSFLSINTLQFVIEAFRGISEHASDYQRRKFRETAAKYQIPEHITKALEDEVVCNTIFDIAVGDKGAFRSHHMRKKFFKSNFDFIEPVEYDLITADGTEHYLYHYVPIKNTLKSFLEDQSVQKLYNKKGESKPGILKDFEDGTAFKANEFFVQNPNGIKIILYMDAFEPCDALKAARGKHKILAVYMALGNMPSYCRSSRDPIQLVMLVEEKTVKRFSYAEVLEPLFNDLASLHAEGIEVVMKGEKLKLKGCLVGVCADNLEAHSIGGFNQGFAWADYYCRYCYSKRAHRIQGDVSVCPRRTCANYDKEAEKAEDRDGSVKGVWESSCFNTLPDFHVINGLPPCSAHDIPEGILPRDLFLALKVLVKKQWFSWNYINARIKFVNGKNASVTIREIKPKPKKIIGSASSNLRLLQIVTLALNDKVQDCYHDAWQMIVTLQQFMSLVCAPEISVEQTFQIDVLAEKYISLRKAVLPRIPLQCKHHYIMHYGELTRKYGPLQRWSTIRFESKHQYFKSASTGNFINPTLSFSTRHQYLQAYLREGNLFSTVAIAESVTPFQRELYSVELLRVVDSCGPFSMPLFLATNIEYHGIQYKAGELLMIELDDYNNIRSVHIDMMIVTDDFKKIIFLGSEKFVVYCPNSGIYEVVPSTNNTLICQVTELANPEPLKLISIGEKCFTFLKHAIVAQF